MTQQQTRLGDDGSDARWFLEVAGVPVEADPWEREPLARGDATTVAGSPEVAPPADAVEGSADPFRDWAPMELSRSARSRRTYRWSFVGAVVLVAVGVVALFAWLPGQGERVAEARAEEYRAALTDLDARSAALEVAIAQLADPTLVDVGPAGVTVAEFQSSVEAAGSLAGEPLPATLPFVPRSDIEALEPARLRLSLVAGTAAEVARALSGAVDYRLSVDDAFILPILPVQATANQIADLSLELASMLADSVGVAATLPDDDVFAEHRRDLEEALIALNDLQVDYLDALRRNDVTAASRLAEQLAALDDGLDDSLAAALAAFAPQVRVQIDALRLDIAAAETLLP